jgi:GxxExxY protein
MQDVMKLCDAVRETAYAIHLYHGHGHLEKVYENALVHRLRKAGFEVEQQKPLTVHDEDGTVVGEYFADLFLDGRLIVELKACRAIVEEHVAQVLDYLRSARQEHGLLINFGSPKFEIKKYVFSGHKPQTRSRVLSLLLSFVPFAFFRG